MKLNPRGAWAEEVILIISLKNLMGPYYLAF